jgi:hypothetical protein
MATDKPICEKCGRIHVTHWGTPACHGHISGSDPLRPCTKAPRKGRLFCRSHGGNHIAGAKQLEQKLALMEAEGEIAQLMREVDLPDQHPIDGLLEVVRVSGAMMRLLTIKVGELEEEPQTRTVFEPVGKDGIKERTVDEGDGFYGFNKDSEMVPHVYVQLLRLWTERYERACKTALDAGIEERRIRLAEDTADTFFTALSKAVAAAELTPTQMEALTRALAKELRTSSDVLELI